MPEDGGRTGVGRNRSGKEEEGMKKGERKRGVGGNCVSSSTF